MQTVKEIWSQLILLWLLASLLACFGTCASVLLLICLLFRWLALGARCSTRSFLLQALGRASLWTRPSMPIWMPTSYDQPSSTPIQKTNEWTTKWMRGKVPLQINWPTRRQTKKHKETNRHAKKKANYQTEPTNLHLQQSDSAAKNLHRQNAKPTNNQINTPKKHKTNKPTN